MARHATPIPPRQVALLARLGLSVPEIADFFRVERTTIYRRFGVELERGRAARPVPEAGTGLPPCYGPGCLLRLR